MAVAFSRNKIWILSNYFILKISWTKIWMLVTFSVKVCKLVRICFIRSRKLILNLRARSILFPYDLIYKWLSYKKESNTAFINREFSFFTIDHHYNRFNSFDNQEALKKHLCSYCPFKIDLGAIYDSTPSEYKQNKNIKLTLLERELTFDIDLTDYDDVRRCCQGTEVCSKCWLFITIGALVLEAYLVNDFGFKNLLWVYSGRRGIHCWVADKIARKLSFTARSAVCDFINLLKGGKFKTKKIEIDGNQGCHPSIHRSVEIIDLYWEQCVLQNQRFLDTTEQVEFVTSLARDDLLKTQLKTALLDSNCQGSRQRWNELVKISKNFYSIENRTTDWKAFKTHRFFVEEIKLQFCFPRLDVNVTTVPNHLLKMPFSVHPTTGQICVPINFKDIKVFDPLTSPKLKDLIDEINTIPTSRDEKLNTLLVYKANQSNSSRNPIQDPTPLLKDTARFTRSSPLAELELLE
ncbi:primase, DNA, polypeptide 1 (49kDa) [Tyrophagus putrescentiae]|nr:primase, DNA, polypeptide 1 (49kDa) [Tyrophagus putrescentiae]